MSHLFETKDLHHLFQGAKLQSIPKGEVLYSSDQPDKLSFIISGFVKSYFIAHNGDLGVQAIYGTGDLFPLPMIFTTLLHQDVYEGQEIYYYEAMTSIWINTIDTARLRQITESNPMLYRELLQNAGHRFRSNIQFLENLRLHGAYSKTAHQLAYFGNRFGEETKDGLQIQLPLTHQDIADIIGTTRETVTAAIIKLRDKKIIKTARTILILDFDKLVAEAYS